MCNLYKEKCNVSERRLKTFTLIYCDGNYLNLLTKEMARILTPNSYKEGDTVSPISNPKQRLIIRRYVDRIYYCRDPKDDNGKEYAFFEREIKFPEK